MGDNHDIRNKAFGHNWIAQGPDSITTDYMVKSLENLSIRSTIEPFTDFKIEVTALRNVSSTSESILRYHNPDANNSNNFTEYSQVTTGSFSISYFVLPTAFIKNNADYSNKIFQTFQNSRITIAKRLAGADPTRSRAGVTKRIQRRG